MSMINATMVIPQDLYDNPEITRVFIVGCPRSGTTLLQSLLTANTRIASFPETHFFERLFSGRLLLSTFGVASREAKSRWKIILAELGHPELNTVLPRHAIFVHQYTNAFVRVLDTLTLRQKKLVWIEKTPGHVHYVNRIGGLVDNTKFIHIIRAGVENIASLYEVGQKYPETWKVWYGTLDQCIQRWVDDVRKSLECSSKENHRVIMYEHLVAAPEELLRQLCEFIGVPFEKGMLTNYAEVASQLVLKQEQWKSSVFRPIEKSSESKFYKVFNEQQRQYILKNIPEDLLSIAMPSDE